MSPGTPDLILLILVFVGLQAWWIIPLIKKNNKLNDRGRELREDCLLYTSPSPRDATLSRMPSSA